ncbi:hypothetical protein BC567DRAFT_211058 [Phyllosticta citribraziliensis]
MAYNSAARSNSPMHAPMRNRVPDAEAKSNPDSVPQATATSTLSNLAPRVTAAIPAVTTWPPFLLPTSVFLQDDQVVGSMPSRPLLCCGVRTQACASSRAASSRPPPFVSPHMTEGAMRRALVRRGEHCSGGLAQLRCFPGTEDGRRGACQHDAGRPGRMGSEAEVQSAPTAVEYRRRHGNNAWAWVRCLDDERSAGHAWEFAQEPIREQRWICGLESNLGYFGRT